MVLNSIYQSRQRYSKQDYFYMLQFKFIKLAVYFQLCVQIVSRMSSPLLHSYDWNMLPSPPLPALTDTVDAVCNQPIIVISSYFIRSITPIHAFTHIFFYNLHHLFMNFSTVNHCIVLYVALLSVPGVGGAHPVARGDGQSTLVCHWIPTVYRPEAAALSVVESICQWKLGLFVFLRR